MGNAFSYLSGVLLNEKMSATERKIGEAKALIKDAAEKLKANEEALKNMADKKTQAAQKAQRSIEYWKSLIANNESRIKDLSRGIENFRDHDPEELEKKFRKEKEQKKHSENFSKMSDEDLQSAAEEHQKNVNELDDENRKKIKEDPKHLAIQKELKKRKMQKIEIKKIKAKAVETDPQPVNSDENPDVTRPTENPDNPNLPDPPATMTNDEHEVLSKVDTGKFTTDKEWDDHLKNIDKHREKVKAKHEGNHIWRDGRSTGFKNGVTPEQAKKDEEAYNKAAELSKANSIKASAWKNSSANKKTIQEPTETPKTTPPESSSKYSKIDNDKDWNSVLTNLKSKSDYAKDELEKATNNNDLSDEEKKEYENNYNKIQAELEDANNQYDNYKKNKKTQTNNNNASSKKSTSETPKEYLKKTVKDAPKDDTSEKTPKEPEHLKFKGGDKSHPLNFNDVEEFKQHHREKAASSEHPTEYGDAVKHIKKVNTEINDLNDEIDLNNKELRNPKTKDKDKEAIKDRNKQIQREIKDLHSSKKEHEKIVNKHEKELSSDFYDQHNKKHELNNKLKSLNDEIDKAESAGEKERSQKLRNDFDEVHSELQKHLGIEEKPHSSGEDNTELKNGHDDIEDAEIDDIDDSEEGDSYSRALAKKTGYEENKFNKEGTPKKIAKEIAKKTGWILNRLGSGLHIQDSSISDIVKDSKSRQALVANYEKLSEWRKQRILKKIKKPLEDHLRDMDDAIEDAEREVEKYETKEILSDTEKNKLKVAKKQLSALHKEQRSAKETYDKIIETGDTKPRNRGVVDVDVKDDSSDDTVDAEIVSSKKNFKDYTSDETEADKVKSLSNDNESKGSVEYLKKLSSDKNSGEDNNEADKESEDHGKPIEGIDFKKDDDGKEENFEPEEKLQNAIYAAQGEIERLGSYDSSEAESMIKSLEGAIKMGNKAIKSNDGIGYALKSLKSSYSKAKTIKESLAFLKDRTKSIKLISESEEVKVEEKIDPSEYLKNILGG